MVRENEEQPSPRGQERGRGGRRSRGRGVGGGWDYRTIASEAEVAAVLLWGVGEGEEQRPHCPHVCMWGRDHGASSDCLNQEVDKGEGLG